MVANTIRYVSTAVVVIVLLFICVCASNTRDSISTTIQKNELDEEELIGKWEGAFNGETGAFIFTADGRVDIIEAGVSTQKNEIKDKGYLSFSVNTSIHPQHLDIMMISSSGKELSRIKMIFENNFHDQIILSPFLTVTDRQSSILI